MSGEAREFYRSLIDFVRWLEKNNDPTLSYDVAKQFSRHFQVASRTQADKLNRYIGKFLEADHLVEKRFLGHLPSANLDPSEWDAKIVPKNKKIALQLNKYRTKGFPYVHSVKTYQLKRLIPHGMEGNFTVQEIWNAHAWVFNKLGLGMKELEPLKKYFRRARPRVKFRIPKRDPLLRRRWKKKAGYKAKKTQGPKKDPLSKMSKKRRRRAERNLERARQRQARERAKARKSADPKGTNDKGINNKVKAESRPGTPGTTRTRRIDMAKIRSVVKAKWLSAARLTKGLGKNLIVGVVIGFLEDWAMEKFMNLLLAGAERKTLEHLEKKRAPEIEDLTVQAVANYARIHGEDARVPYIVTKYRLVFGPIPGKRFFLQDMLIDRVFVSQLAVERVHEGKPSRDLKDHWTGKIIDADKIIKVLKCQRSIEYDKDQPVVPITTNMTYGEKLAASGSPLSIGPPSHGDPTGKKRLQIIHDYIVFTKQYPQLTDQYSDAWRRYKHELCVAGYQDLFTESEIEACKWQRHAEEISKARGTANRSLVDEVIRYEEKQNFFQGGRSKGSGAGGSF